MIPTAEEFIANWFKHNKVYHPTRIAGCLKAFAKLHKDAALSKASDEAKINGDEQFEPRRILKESILEAYPDTNIK